MKKFYISLLGLLALNTVSAQLVNNSNTAPAKKNSTFAEKVKPSASLPEKGITLWQNDFSTPSQWTMTNTSSPAYDWIITSDANLIPVTALAPAAFTTVSNGYALIDSDGQGQSATQNANLTWNGAAIDLTGQPNVSLVFQQSYRTYLDTRIVRVSNDGGSTWTDFVVTDGTEVTGINTANPDTYSIDISSVAGNQANVKIQFNYQGAWGWYWAVDDVKITVTDNYDLKLNSVYWGSTGFWGVRLPYYQIPANQVAPIEFGGIVKNNGVMTQNDITFTATIPSLYSGVSAMATLAGTQFDTLDCATAFTPAATVAAHTVNFAAVSSATEAYPVDNTIAPLTLNVTNYIYARDGGVIAGGSYNAGDGFESGNIFDMYNTAVASAIDVVIASTAVAGAEIYVKLYSIDAATGDFLWMDESFPYVLTAGNLGQKITLPLQNAQTLNAGESYLAVVGSFGDGGASNDLVVGTSGVSEPQTTFYYDMTDATWYYSTSTPMVRLNFSPAAINEVENNFGLNVYPNPANTSATVSLELSNEADVTINVTDLSGKVVYTNALGTVNGAQSVTVNTDALTSGVYMVNVTVDGTVSTQKLVVRK
jgi:hypothetical protein